MRRRYGRMNGRMNRNPGLVRKIAPSVPVKNRSDHGYIPNVKPFMQSSGYTEGLEEILAEIDRLQVGSNFYYDQGDLWRKKP